MAIKSDLNSELGLIITRVDGAVDDETTLEAEILLGQLGSFNPDYKQLADSRQVSQNLLTAEGLLKISSATPFSQKARRAYVVNDELAIMYATLFGITVSEDKNYFVTKDIKAACEWLNVPYEVVMTSSLYVENE